MYITVNNQLIYYQKVGKGKDLILLHGWGQDVSTFWPLIEGLKDHFTLWMIDLPGFGRSELPKKPFTVGDYAETIKDFITVQKIRKPDLLGHSLGGRVAIKLTSLYPNLIDKLILEDSAGIVPKENRLKQMIFMVGAKVVKYAVPDFFGIKTSLRRSVYKALESDYLDAGEMKETLKTTIKEDLTPDLEKISNKTLVIWGENDKTVTVSYGKKMYRLIPNAQLEVIDNTAHFPHLENSKRFLHYITDFLQ